MAEPINPDAMVAAYRLLASLQAARADNEALRMALGYDQFDLAAKRRLYNLRNELDYAINKTNQLTLRGIDGD